MSDFYNEYEQEPKRSPGKIIVIVAVVLAAAVIGGLFSRYILPQPTQTGGQNDPTASPTAQVTPEATPKALQTAEPGRQVVQNNIPDIYDAVHKAVVSITNNKKQVSYSGDEAEIPKGTGSGVIISTDGYIVTNNHVIEGADSIKVTLSDGTKLDAELIGSDPYVDLAVRKVEKDNLTALPLGDSDSTRVGELAIAIGSPLGNELAGTLTVGYISAVNRHIEVNGIDYVMMQTDAAINPGNSGGALVDGNGKLIGINTLKSIFAGVSNMGTPISSEGIGYAIPINVAKPIIDDLIKTGKVQRPVIGVTGQSITAQYAQYYDVPEGFGIKEVVENGPAAKAGLQKGDIIVGINDKRITTFQELYNVINSHKIGDKVTLRVWRDGSEKDYELVLGGNQE